MESDGDLVLAMAIVPADEKASDEATDEIEDEIPAGIDVAADIGAREKENSNEFNDLVQRAKSHACGGCEGESTTARKGPCWSVALQLIGEGVPANPCCDAKTIGMNQLVIFQQVRNEP
jgi:hypothetical protein